MASNTQHEQGKRSPASLVRPVGSTYKHIPTKKTYKQMATPLGNLWEEIDVAASTVLVYESVLNQTSTDPPVPSVGQDSLGTTLTYSYVGVGVYRVTAADPIFVENKTNLIIGSVRDTGEPEGDYNARVKRVSDTILEIRTRSTIAGGDDLLLNETAFNIKIYS